MNALFIRKDSIQRGAQGKKKTCRTKKNLSCKQISKLNCFKVLTRFFLFLIHFSQPKKDKALSFTMQHNNIIVPLGPVHTYTDIFESATFSLRIRLPSTRIRRIRQRIRKKINTLSKVEKNISATNPLTCGRVNPDIFYPMT